MIKKVITLVLLVAFAIHTFSRVMIVFGFYANQKTIAATLCENRDKPILKCDGKCFLAKKLQAQEKKDQQNPERKIENKTEDLSSRSFYSVLSGSIFTDIARVYEKEPFGKPVHRSFTVFHPPIAAVHFT
jgi:hypothetical protein